MKCLCGCELGELNERVQIFMTHTLDGVDEVRIVCPEDDAKDEALPDIRLTPCPACGRWHATNNY